MSNQQPTRIPDSPWIYVGIAVVLGVIVGYAEFMGAPDRIVIAAAGVVAVIATMGAVGVGVLTGVRRADYLRDQP